jgi:hypothetical protein
VNPDLLGLDCIGGVLLDNDNLTGLTFCVMSTGFRVYCRRVCVALSGGRGMTCT